MPGVMIIRNLLLPAALVVLLGPTINAATPATPIERERASISTSASIKDHIAKARDTVPAGLVQIAEHVLAPPKVAWRRTLAAAVRQGVARRGWVIDSQAGR